MRKAHVIKMYWSFTGNRFYQELVNSCLDKRRKAYFIKNSKTLVNYSEQVLPGKGSFSQKKMIIACFTKNFKTLVNYSEQVYVRKKWEKHIKTWETLVIDSE